MKTFFHIHEGSYESIVNVQHNPGSWSSIAPYDMPINIFVDDDDDHIKLSFDYIDDEQSTHRGEFWVDLMVGKHSGKICEIHVFKSDHAKRMILSSLGAREDRLINQLCSSHSCVLNTRVIIEIVKKYLTDDGKAVDI